MKAFRFRLDSVARWRATQVVLEENRVAAAATRLQAIRSAIEARQADLKEGAIALTRGAGGDTLQAWAAWVKKCERDLQILAQQAQVAAQTLAGHRENLVKATRDRELIGKLRETALAEWQGELAREVEAFAGESFLRRVTIGKRTGA